MSTIPDQLDITYEGTKLYTTGDLVSVVNTMAVSYSSDSDLATITGSVPRSGTTWEVTLFCRVDVPGGGSGTGSGDSGD